jgi:protein involved in polysaccharide export with SLBB domain
MMAALDETKKLGSGDKVSYRVLEDLDPPTKGLTVGDSGGLDAPYYGQVQAEKKTCKQLALEIKGLLEKKNYRRATVIIMLEETNKKRINGKVYVTGQVHLTGPYEIPDDEVFTVSKAILKAGGFSDFADKRHVRLIRSGVQGQDPKNNAGRIINVAEILEKGKTGNDVPVQADDIIYVPKRSVNF